MLNIRNFLLVSVLLILSAAGMSAQTVVNGGYTFQGPVIANNNLIAKGPDPFIDATAYGAVSSTATFGSTCNATSPNVTLTATYSAPNTLPGDWKNGQYISLFGCGPLATVPAPNITAISISSISRLTGVVTATVSSVGPVLSGSYVKVTGVTDTTYNGVFFVTGGNGSTTITWNQTGSNTSSSGGTVAPGFAIYEGTNPGSTTYTYSACSIDNNGGCSAKSTDVTVTNGPATLTALDNNWIYFGQVLPGAFGFPGATDYLCVYRNGSFIGRAYMPAFNDDGTNWSRNISCPSTPPSTATADVLKTTIVSGAGTNNLVLAANATTSNTSAFTFHDSQIPITNALNAAIAAGFSGIGGPQVFLPSGYYQVSRLVIGGPGPRYTLDVSGVIEPVTDPIFLSYFGSLIGHSYGANDVYFNINDQMLIQTDSTAVYTPQGIRSEMDGVVFEGGNQTLRGATTSTASGSHDLIFANTASIGTSDVTVDNFQGLHSTGGDCLYANANTIFFKIYNFRCQAATIANGASTNRFSVYLTDVWNNGSNVSVDGEFRDIGLTYGAFKLDAPAPNAGQGITGWKFNKWSQIFTETVLSKGLFTMDTGCTNSPYDTKTAMIDNILEFFIGSDQAAFKGEYYFPRAGTTGCAGPNMSGLAGNDSWHMPRGGDPTIGADVPMVVTSNSVSPWDGNILHADTDLNLGETRVGALRSIIGGQFFMNYPGTTGFDVPEGAILIPPPAFTITSGGAGGSCSASVTYYFALSQGDGVGWTKITPQTQETSASTGAGSTYITINYAPAYASPKYRIWYGTTSGGETSYFETTNQTSYNFGCGAPTGTGIPQTTSTAYWMKLASEGGVDSWFGLPGDHFGIGKNPANLGTTYTLDIGGAANIDASLSLLEVAAPTGVSSTDKIWADSTAHTLKMNPNNSGAQLLAGFTSTPTNGDCTNISVVAGVISLGDAGGSCTTSGGGLNTSMSNMANPTAMSQSLIPGAANSIALGSQALPFTNGFFGTVANQSGSFNTANLTANRVINWPDATSTTVRACASVSNQFLTAIAVATGVCSQAQPTLANIAAGASPSGLFDFSGSTMKIPQAAGFTVSSSSTIGLDTTAHSVHLYVNSADSIASAFASAPAGSLCVQTSGTTGLLVEASGVCGTVTPSSTNTLTNKTYNAESTGNVLSEPVRAFFPAGGCNNSVAGNGWDIGVTNAPLPQCSGTTVRKGTLAFAQGNVGYLNFHLPSDWNSSASTDIEICFTTTDTTNGHVTSFNIQTGFNAVNGTVTDDPTLNTLQALSVTTGASQVSGGELCGKLTSMTMTGSAADYNFEIAVTRNNSGTDTNTDTAVAVKSAELIYGVTKNAANR